jgi:hypothetical protein
MISNIADRTDARILSSDEIDAVAGANGALLGVIAGLIIGAGIAAVSYRAGQDSVTPAASHASGGYEARGEPNHDRYAALYVRVSTDHQTVGNQIRELSQA